MEKLTDYKQLRVYQEAMEASMIIFEVSKRFPPEEKYSLVDQIRRSSRSVCANIAEAWSKRLYSAHFVSKITDAEAEAQETRVWIEFCERCGYLSDTEVHDLDDRYKKVTAQLIKMRLRPDQWVI